MIDEKNCRKKKRANVAEDNDDESNDEDEGDSNKICNRRMTMFEFKRIVCEQLVSPFLNPTKNQPKKHIILARKKMKKRRCKHLEKK